MLARLSLLFALLASLATTSVANRSHMVRRRAPRVLIDAWPAITSPAAGESYKAGEVINITWSQDLAQKYNSNQIGQFADFELYYLANGSSVFQGRQVIASDVALYSGDNSIQVLLSPLLKTFDTYHITLVGSTSDKSAAFSIEGLID